MISWAPDLSVRGHLAPRVPRRAVLLLLAVVAIAAEALALRPVLFDREAPIVGLDVVFSLVGGSFAAFGLVAWHRRPDSRSGLLMTATGLAFFASPLLSQIHEPLAFTAMALLVDLWVFFFVALLLTLLTRGRLQPGVDRWLVAAYALPLGVLQLAFMLFSDSDGQNLLAVFPDEDVADMIDRIQRGMIAAICGATVAVLAARWLAASAPRRRALLPSLAGALPLALFAALLVNDLISGTRSQALLWAAACSFVAVPAAFLAGLLRSRLARGGLTDLYRGLGAMQLPDLQAALRRALGDPGLVLALPGDPAPAPAPGHRIAPVERGGREVAAIVYDASLDDDPELLEAARAATALALENQQLVAESQAQLDELRASRERIVAAGDAERRRLERNLHDGAQQRLVAIALQLRLLQRRVDHDPSAAELVTTASDELARSLAELRELARGIHPAVLEHGLGPALKALATRSPVATTVFCDTRGELPEAVELAAYFVTSEALANVAKYAHADHASVRVWCAGSLANVQVADDGVGGADDSRGSGLRGLADRVEALDGRLRVVSPRGRGTTVTAELPCGERR
jgi:signal transduction histidine kinase